MTPEPFSQSQLARYAECQRKYEFDYTWEVQTPDERMRYLNRGTVLHSTIEDVCTHVQETPHLDDDEIRAFAHERVEKHWNETMDRGEYYSDAEFEEDWLATRARIESFFQDGPGIRHARNSLATELYVSFERNGTRYHGYIDNVVRTEEGVTLVDYKASSISIPFSRRYVRKHLDEGYRPARVKPAIQAGLYLEGIKTTDFYEPEMDLEFVFYELKKRSSGKEVTRDPEGVTVTVEGNDRPVAEDYREQRADVWELIETCVEGIHREDFTPAPFDEIYTDTCSNCDFRSICPEYLDQEINQP